MQGPFISWYVVRVEPDRRLVEDVGLSSGGRNPRLEDHLIARLAADRLPAVR